MFRWANEEKKFLKLMERKHSRLWKNENSPYTPVEVELFMVKGPSMTSEERSSSDPRWKARAILLIKQVLDNGPHLLLKILKVNIITSVWISRPLKGNPQESQNLKVGEVNFTEKKLLHIHMVVSYIYQKKKKANLLSYNWGHNPSSLFEQIQSSDVSFEVPKTILRGCVLKFFL